MNAFPCGGVGFDRMSVSAGSRARLQQSSGGLFFWPRSPSVLICPPKIFHCDRVEPCGPVRGECGGLLPRRSPPEPIPSSARGGWGRGQGKPGESDNPAAWPRGPAVGIPRLALPPPNHASCLTGSQPRFLRQSSFMWSLPRPSAPALWDRSGSLRAPLFGRFFLGGGFSWRAERDQAVLPSRPLPSPPSFRVSRGSGMRRVRPHPKTAPAPRSTCRAALPF